GGDITLCSPGALSVTSPINAGAGTVRLHAAGGAVTQTAGAAITAANLGVIATGNIDLAGSSNAVPGIVALDGTAAPAGSFIHFLDSTGFSVGGTITALGCFPAPATGILANAGPVTPNAGSTIPHTAVAH